MKTKLKFLAILMLFAAFAFTACGGDSSSDPGASVVPPTVLFTEDFESYTVGTWTPAGGWTPNNNRGTWSIANDGSKVLRYVADPVNGSSLLANGDNIWVNCSFSVKAKLLSGVAYAGIGRYNSSGRYYLLYIGQTSIQLWKSGVGLLQSAGFTTNYGHFYTLKLVFNDQNMKGYIDGIKYIDCTDTSMGSDYDKGMVGLMSDDDGITPARYAIFDDVEVTTP